MRDILIERIVGLLDTGSRIAIGTRAGRLRVGRLIGRGIGDLHLLELRSQRVMTYWFSGDIFEEIGVALTLCAGADS